MNSNSTVEILDFWTCLFLDSPSGPSQIPLEERVNINSSDVSYIFYECRAYGKYLAKGDPRTVIIDGHYMCMSIFLLIMMVGCLGMVFNVLNVLVLRKSHQGSSLKDLLVILAVVEWIVCFSGIVFAFLIVNVLENINRSKAVYQWFRVFNILYALSRTGSIYVTILVTVERYLVVAFPVQSKLWLTNLRSRIYLLIVAVITFVLNTSILFNAAVSTVEDNDIFPPHTHVENFPYIFKDTHFTNRDAQELLVILNYVAPFPFLLFFNTILYKSIYSWSKGRVRLTGNQKREINTAKMFSLVVLILLACHTSSCVIFYTSRFQKLIYRELIFLQFLCVITGATVNFLVYYIFCRGFKQEFLKLMMSMRHHKFCTLGL